MNADEERYIKRVWSGKRCAAAREQLLSLDISPTRMSELQAAYEAIKIRGPFWNTKARDWYVEMYYSAGEGVQISRRRKGTIEGFLDVSAVALEFARFAVEGMHHETEIREYYAKYPAALTPEVADYLASIETRQKEPIPDSADDSPAWRFNGRTVRF